MPSSPLILPRQPGTLAGRVVAGVLKRSATVRRLVHDAGFHKERIAMVKTALDGTHLVTASTDGTVRLWEAASGRCIHTYDCRDSDPSAIFPSPARPRMVTAAALGWKKIWSLDDGKCLAVLTDHPGIPVHCDDAFFYCKQNWMVQNFPDRRTRDPQRSEVILYEVDSGKKARTFQIEGSHITSLKVSPDSAMIAAVNSDHHLRIWDPGSGRLLHVSPHGHPFQGIVGISPDNRFIVLRSATGVDVLDVAGSSIAFTITTQGANYRSRYVLRGFHLIEKNTDYVYPSHTSAIRIIDIRTGETLQTGTFKGDLELWSVMVEDNLCLEFPDGRVDVWNIKDNEVVASFPLNPESPGSNPGTAAFTGKCEIALARQETAVRVIGPLSGRPPRLIPATDPVRDILITPDGKGLLTMGAAAVKHWDLTSGLCLREFGIPGTECHDDLPQGAPLMALTPDGKNLLLPMENGIAIHDLSTGQQEGGFSFEAQLTRPGKDGQPGHFALYVTEDGKRLIVVSGPDGFLGSCYIPTGIPVAGFPLRDVDRFHAFCMSQHLLTTSRYNVLSLWDARTGGLLHECRQDGRISDIVMVPSQRTIVTVSEFGLSFLNWESGELLMKRSHSNGIGSAPHRFERWLAPLSGGKRFIVQRSDLIALWDPDTQGLVWRQERYLKNRATKAAAFPDGERFATVDTTGTVEFWNVEKGKVLATLHVLPEGFLWETPPDKHAPSGWLWTDREDLVSVVAPSRDDRDTRVFRQGHAKHRAYMKIYNNRGMVMAKIAGNEQYRRHVELHGRASDRARIGDGFAGLHPALS